MSALWQTQRKRRDTRWNFRKNYSLRHFRSYSNIKPRRLVWRAKSAWEKWSVMKTRRPCCPSYIIPSHQLSHIQNLPSNSKFNILHRYPSTTAMPPWTHICSLCLRKWLSLEMAAGIYSTKILAVLSMPNELILCLELTKSVWISVCAAFGLGFNLQKWR